MKRLAAAHGYLTRGNERQHGNHGAWRNARLGGADRDDDVLADGRRLYGYRQNAVGRGYAVVDLAIDLIPLPRPGR